MFREVDCKMEFELPRDSWDVTAVITDSKKFLYDVTLNKVPVWLEPFESGMNQFFNNLKDNLSEAFPSVLDFTRFNHFFKIDFSSNAYFKYNPKHTELLEVVPKRCLIKGRVTMRYVVPENVTIAEDFVSLVLTNGRYFLLKGGGYDWENKFFYIGQDSLPNLEIIEDKTLSEVRIDDKFIFYREWRRTA